MGFMQRSILFDRFEADSGEMAKAILEAQKQEKERGVSCS